MKFALKKQDLLREFNFLSAALPRGFTDGLVKHWLTIDVETDGRVVLKAWNATKYLTTVLQSEEGFEPGHLETSPYVIGKLIPELPLETIQFKRLRDRLRVDWSTGHCILAPSAMNGPILPGLTGDVRSFMLSKETFRDALKRTSFATPETFDSRFCGVRFELSRVENQSYLRCIAVEGAAMAVVERSAGLNVEQDAFFHLPTVFCEGVTALFKDATDKNEFFWLALGDRAIEARCGVRTFRMTATGDTFPNWRQMLIDKPKVRADFPLDNALDALKRATLYEDTVVMSLERGQLTFKSDDASESVGMDYDGEPISYRFKTQFLKGAFYGLTSARVELIGLGPNQHIVLRPLGAVSEQFVLMPMRVSA